MYGMTARLGLPLRPAAAASASTASCITNLFNKKHKLRYVKSVELYPNLDCKWWMFNLYHDLKYILKIGGVEVNPGPNVIKDVKVAHININSITSEGRLEELENFVENNNIKVLALSETKLDENVHPSLFRISDFQQPFTRHRNRKGGGVALYCRTSIAVNRLPELEIGDEEWIWAKLKFGSCTKIICALYLPPNMKADRLQEFLANFTESISAAQQFGPSNIIVIGDFNAGNEYLQNNFIKHSPIKPFERELKLIADSLTLTQLITEPTRIEGMTRNIRDLCFVSNCNLVTQSGILSSFSHLDHFPIFVSVQGSIPNPAIKEKKLWDYCNMDVQRLTQTLITTNWDEILDNDIDTATNLFTSTLVRAAHDCIPQKNNKI